MENLRIHRSGIVHFVVLLFSASLSFSAQADIYKWVDDEGNVHFSDQPIAPPSGDASTLERFEDKGTHQPYANPMTGNEDQPLRVIGLTSVKMELENPEADLGSCKQHAVSVDQAKKSIDMKYLSKRFYERLDDDRPSQGLRALGLRPRRTGTYDHLEAHPPESFDLRVVAVIRKAKFANCARDVTLTVHWTVLDDGDPNLRITATTDGRSVPDNPIGYPALPYVLAKAFGDAASELPFSFPPGTSFATEQMPETPSTSSDPAASRLIVFGRMERDLAEGATRKLGKDCNYPNKQISSTELNRIWGRAPFQEILYEALDERGHRTLPADTPKHKRAQKKIISVTGIVKSVQFNRCGHAATLMVRWHIFDYKTNRIVLDKTIKGLGTKNPGRGEVSFVQGPEDDVFRKAVRNAADKLIASREFISIAGPTKQVPGS